VRGEVRAAILLHSVARKDQDGTRAGALAAFDVGALVADEIGPRQVDVVGCRRFQHHARLGLAPGGRRRRRIGAEISRVDRVRSDLAQQFLLNGVVLRLCNQAARDAALVGYDERAEASLLQLPQRLWNPREDPDPGGIAAVMDLLHEGAVAVEEHCPRPAHTWAKPA